MSRSFLRTWYTASALIGCGGAASGTMTDAASTSTAASGAPSGATTAYSGTASTSGSATTGDAPPELPEPPTSCEAATFELAGAIDGTYDWSAPEQLISCSIIEDTPAGWRARLALSPDEGGMTGLHIDISYYGVDGPAWHDPNPYPGWPPDAGTFDLFVSPGGGQPFFVNMEGAQDCTAAITLHKGDQLAGTFRCDNLVEIGEMPDPSRTLDVADGQFCCRRP